MANYLLDTSVIVDYLRGKTETVDYVKKLFYDGFMLGCCSINIIEVYAGMRENEKKITEEFLDSLEYYEMTKDIAQKAGEYKNSYQNNGISPSLPDFVIAAIVISNGLILVTNNLKHYPMVEIKKQHPV